MGGPVRVPAACPGNVCIYGGESEEEDGEEVMPSRREGLQPLPPGAAFGEAVQCKEGV